MNQLELLSEILASLQRIEGLLAGNNAPQQANNAPDGSFAASEMICTVSEGKAYWKVKGGQFTKFGVTIWPEVLQAAGFDPDTLNPMKPVSLAGYTAHYVLNDEGKAQKVTALTKAAVSAPPPPVAPIAPKTAASPIPEKDWMKEAASCTDELFFDSAMVNAAPWFREATAVTTFRTTIFGEWNPATAAAQAVGMVEYANQREAGKPHATAKLEAMNRYSRKLEAERKAAPKDDKLGAALRDMRQNDGRIGLAKAQAAHRATAN